MKIENMSLKNFRNIVDLKVEPHPQINIIYGNNAQGKSNFLEAIGCLGLGKSLRVSNEKSLLKCGEQLFYIKINAKSNDNDLSVEMGYDGNNKKVKVNNIVKHRMIDFIGNLKVVYFTPEDLSLIKGGPSERRKYLDTMLCQVSNKYSVNLITYRKILEQRNKVLKEKPRKANSLLDVLDIQLSNYGVDIWLLRKQAMDRIKEIAPVFFQNISNNTDILSLSHKISFKVNEDAWNKEFLKEKLIEELSKCREHDFMRGYSTVGVHRDDISIELNNMDTKIYASQGQQRLISLSLRIAEMKFIEDITEESPILLLDDILSELDNDKINKLIDTLAESNRQVFITTAQPLNIRNNRYTIWKMKNGILEKEV